MKKLFLILAAGLMCLASCTNDKNSYNTGIVSSVKGEGTQTVTYSRPGQTGASAHITITVTLKDGNEYLGQKLKNEIKYNNSTIYSATQELKTSYTFEFDKNFTYSSGVDQSQQHELFIYSGENVVGKFKYTASVEWKTPSQTDDL